MGPALQEGIGVDFAGDALGAALFTVWADPDEARRAGYFIAAQQLAARGVVGGHVQAQIDSNLLPQLQSGGVRGIGYVNNEKWPGFEQLPTLQEQGVDVPHMSWFGFVARKGTPAEAVNGMAAAVEKALQRDDVKERLLKLALYPGFLGPEDFAAQIERDQASFKAVLSKLGAIKAK